MFKWLQVLLFDLHAHGHAHCVKSHWLPVIIVFKLYKSLTIFIYRSTFVHIIEPSVFIQVNFAHELMLSL